MAYQISDRERLILKDLQRIDPDGWPTRPTDEQRAGFRSWVATVCGREIEALYFDTNWDEVT